MYSTCTYLQVFAWFPILRRNSRGSGNPPLCTACLEVTSLIDMMVMNLPATAEALNLEVYSVSSSQKSLNWLTILLFHPASMLKFLTTPNGLSWDQRYTLLLWGGDICSAANFKYVLFVYSEAFCDSEVASCICRA